MHLQRVMRKEVRTLRKDEYSKASHLPNILRKTRRSVLATADCGALRIAHVKHWNWIGSSEVIVRVIRSAAGCVMASSNLDSRLHGTPWKRGARAVCLGALLCTKSHVDRVVYAHAAAVDLRNGPVARPGVVVEYEIMHCVRAVALHARRPAMEAVTA